MHLRIVRKSEQREKNGNNNSYVNNNFLWDMKTWIDDRSVCVANWNGANQTQCGVAIENILANYKQKQNEISIQTKKNART